MSSGKVLNPSVALAVDCTSPGPDAGNLAGKIIGIRRDEIWRCWDWITDIWADEFRAAGATVKFWRCSQGRTGAEGERIAASLDMFLDQIDIALVGLANCGSCTGWTVRDSISAAEKGLPTTAVCTKNFVDLSRALARRGGRSGLRLHVLPYPLNECEREEVDRVAREHISGIIQTMGVQLGTKLKEAV
jgi:hypothetical protein